MQEPLFAADDKFSGKIQRRRQEIENEKIQRLLASLGEYTGRIDGEVGVKIKETVKALQKRFGLVVDGFAGRKFQEAFAIYSLQHFLRSYGHLTQTDGVDGATFQDGDGNKGPHTRRAVRAFQADFGLKADGIAGGKTKAQIERSTIQVQKFLQRQKCFDGITLTGGAAADGIWGVRTTKALQQFQENGKQWDQDMRTDGVLDAKTKNRIDAEATQYFLKVMGFYRGEVDGRVLEKTKDALAQYQKKRGIEGDGDSGPLGVGTVTRLQMEEDAKDLQRFLQGRRGQKLRYKGLIDGVLSERTVQALAHFQQEMQEINKVKAEKGSVLGEVTEWTRELIETYKLQQFLANRDGLYAGKVDGLKGTVLEEAIKRYQRENNLKDDGKALDKTNDWINKEKVQRFLALRKFYDGAVDGNMGDATKMAVRNYQRANGLKVDGKAESVTQRKILAEIIALQEFLSEGSGGYQDSIDGMVGDKTIEAVKRYQRAEGLVVDGLIGEVTHAHMQYPFRQPGIPNPHTLRPIVVCVNVQISTLYSVNDATGRFSVEFTMYTSWEDENFEDVVNSTKARHAEEIQWDRHWKPKLDFTNAVDVMEMNETGIRVYKQSDGETRVMTTTQIKGEFYQEFDLKKFPFDVQSLKIGIRARSGSDKIIFTSSGAPDFDQKACVMAEWSCSDQSCKNEKAKAYVQIDNKLPSEEEMAALEKVQRFLASQGYYEGAIDCNAGRKTQLAVSRFQGANELPQVDGPTGSVTQGQIEEAVREKQQFLVAEGYECKEDGFWGDRTAEMFKKYQTEQGLIGDGVIGMKTKEKMEKTAERHTSDSDRSSFSSEEGQVDFSNPMHDGNVLNPMHDGEDPDATDRDEQRAHEQETDRAGDLVSERPACTFAFPIVRKEGYYIFNIVPLNTIIIFLAWSAFALPLVRPCTSILCVMRPPRSLTFCDSVSTT
jgi:peptidoglycan hydrolase-like protein with peptidoglycan-binding domain